MINYRVTTKDDFTTVTYKQKDALQVNQREMGMFDSNAIPGFMKPRLDAANEMSFVAPACVPLKKYLTKEGSVAKVYNVLRQTMNMMNQVTANQLFVQNVLLDMKYVFVREMTDKVYFVYEPYLKNVTPAYVFSFLLEVVNVTKTKDKEQQVRLSQLKSFLNTHSRLDELDGYLSQMDAKKGVTPMNAKPSVTPMADEGTVLLSVEDEGTTVLTASQDFELETTVLRREPMAKLTRNRSGAGVQLIGSQITIGRSADNVVVISDITDVSRHHAVITKNNGTYTLKDLGSKNGSTINGRMIQRNVNETIQSGDVLAFAEEAFTFTVE